jgi:stringent starvation protein B
MKDMTPNRPYLLRAFNEWIVDNELTPHIVVDTNLPHVQVPQQSIQDGQIVLNINPSAVQGLVMDDEHVSFSARFGGVPFQVYVPMYAISAIYARENGAGTMFPPEEYDLEFSNEEASETPTSESAESVEKPILESVKDQSEGTKKSSKSRSHLSIVK